MLEPPSALFKSSILLKAVAHTLFGWPWGLGATQQPHSRARQCDAPLASGVVRHNDAAQQAAVSGTVNGAANSTVLASVDAPAGGSLQPVQE